MFQIIPIAKILRFFTCFGPRAWGQFSSWMMEQTKTGTRRTVLLNWLLRRSGNRNCVVPPYGIAKR